MRAGKGAAHRWGVGGRGRGSQLEAMGFQEHTRGQWLWSHVLSAASSFCAGSARHHSHKLCRDKATVSGLLCGPHEGRGQYAGLEV